MGLNGFPGRPRATNTSAAARRSRSPKASTAVTLNPAFAADRASARVLTPAIRTCPRPGSPMGGQSQALTGGFGRQKVQVVEHGSPGAAQSQTVDQGCMPTPGEAV